MNNITKKRKVCSAKAQWCSGLAVLLYNTTRVGYVEKTELALPRFVLTRNSTALAE